MNTIRLMVVDDVKGNREYVKFGISNGRKHPSIAFELVQEVENGEKAIHYLERCEGKERPDVILMDIRFEKQLGLNGLAATKIITARYPTIKVIIWSQYDDLEYVKQAFRNRASGYFLKNAEEGFDDLCQGIVSVWDGRYYVTQRILAQMVTLLTGDPTGLTPREWEGAHLYAQGYTGKDIANRLNISPKTVETHISNVRKKLKATSADEVKKKLEERESTTDQRLFGMTS